MTDTYQLTDPFHGKVVEISNKLTDRLRGRYASGPTMPDGEPEFGWREFPVPPIQVEAAAEIERLQAELAALSPPPALGPVAVCLTSNRATRGEASVRLAPNQAVILSTLLAAEAAAVTDAALACALWGQSRGQKSGSAVRTEVCLCRARLKPLNVGISHTRGAGYRLELHQITLEVTP